MGCCEGGEKDLSGVVWEARPIIYMTLSLDPKYIPTREAMLERLDVELEQMRRGVIEAWDSVTEHAS